MAADELDIISPPEVILAIGGRDYRVTAVTIGRLPGFVRAAQPLLTHIAALVSPAHQAQRAAAVLAMLDAEGDRVVDLMAAATGASRDAMAAASVAETLAAFPEIIRINGDLFSTAEGATATAGTAWTWADTLQTLIASGHTMDDIRGYTVAQAQAFLAAADRAERRRSAGEAVSARMAQAEGSAWKRYIRELLHG